MNLTNSIFQLYDSLIILIVVVIGEPSEPFGQCYPEELETSLDSGHLALTCRFNRWGTLVVAGCNDGYLVIYDFVTRRMVKKYVTHMHAITAVSWSRDGKYLLSSSFDETIVVSDVVAGETVKKFSMPSIVNDIQMHPVKKDHYLICFLQHMPILMTIDDQRTIIPIETEKNTTEISGIVASFDKSGNRIICGNNKGKVMVYDVDSLSLIASFVVTGNHPIRSLIVAPRGDFFLTNSNDRIIRVFTLSTVLEAGVDGTVLPNQKVQDSVNRTSWKVCRFSGDAEYICAGSSGSHSLYIWERNNGSLVKILQGSKGEQVADLIWHPTRAAAFSISNGKLLLWSQSPTENWSAFAPDFKELDENIEYEERESEFDVEDEDRSIPETENVNCEDQVDLTVIDQKLSEFGYSSDEDGMDSLRLILIAPDVENPEETLPDANKDAASKAEPVPAGKKRETAAKMTTPVCRSVRTTETRRRRGNGGGGVQVLLDISSKYGFLFQEARAGPRPEGGAWRPGDAERRRDPERDGLCIVIIVGVLYMFHGRGFIYCSLELIKLFSVEQREKHQMRNTWTDHLVIVCVDDNECMV
ncbi:Retinoblastoma-binding protein 5 [Trichinella sp. T8]|nr:Retinoblastoma-binding protein 5 [Trichinella sp. T8]